MDDMAKKIDVLEGLEPGTGMNKSSISRVESGVKEVVLNGEKLADNFISADKLADTNEINVILG